MARRTGKRLSRSERLLLRKRRKRKRIIILIVEILLLAVLSVGAYAVFKLDKLDFNVLDKKNLEVYKDTGDFTNIALFGLDSREAELEGDVRSDSMMIASIDNKTNAVKIISVYRDTLMQQKDESYDKANAAYAFGGPEEAIALLNRNLDLDIQKYITVNFNSLADVIDLLGGIEIELTGEEIFWMNGYASETSQVVGRPSTELDPEAPGVYTLDGIQAVSYARIRYTEGDDFKRAERQRIVLEKVVEKAKTASIITLNKIIDQVMPQVSTNLTTTNMLGIAANAISYEIVKMSGFPFDITTSENVIGLEGSYAFAIGHADNVKQLHAYLFNVKDYKVSEKVQSIDADIAYLTGESGEDTQNVSDGETEQLSEDGYTDVPEENIYSTEEQEW